MHTPSQNLIQHPHGITFFRSREPGELGVIADLSVIDPEEAASYPRALQEAGITCRIIENPESFCSPKPVLLVEGKENMQKLYKSGANFSFQAREMINKCKPPRIYTRPPFTEAPGGNEDEKDISGEDEFPTHRHGNHSFTWR